MLRSNTPLLWLLRLEAALGDNAMLFDCKECGEPLPVAKSNGRLAVLEGDRVHVTCRDVVSDCTSCGTRNRLFTG